MQTAIKSENRCNWRQILTNLITDPAELLSYLQIDQNYLPAAINASRSFPLRVPHGFVERMHKKDINDPLLRQVLPLAAEFDQVAGFSHDPLAEQAVNPQPGLLHKYHGRVLLMVTSACAINCRYCFRRHFPYAANNPSRKQWQAALDHIADDSSIREVILSGGEPLLADDDYLQELVQRIAAIPHVTTLRIHTRMPIVIPERVTSEMLSWLTTTRLQPVVVVHCNHAQEIDDNVRDSLLRLGKANVTVLNQSVFLRGVNDSVSALQSLSQTLFAAGVLPYYLHLLDKVQGAAHFDVTAESAKQIWKGLQASLPGYLVPRLVREQAGGVSKTVITE